MQISLCRQHFFPGRQVLFLYKQSNMNNVLFYADFNAKCLNLMLYGAKASSSEFQEVVL